MKNNLFHPSKWIFSINLQWNTIKYTDFNWYFSFKYLNDWTVWNPSEDFESLIFSDVDQELRGPHLWIIRRYVNENIDIDELLVKFSKNLNNNWFNLDDVEQVKTDSLDWIRLTLTNTVESKKYRMAVIISVIEQKKIYLLSYVASEQDFEENLEWFDQIVQSFKVLK